MSFTFDPARWTLVPERSFEQLQVSEIFRAPSRTVTSAHASAFQTVSCDNHPIHYDVEYARRFGHPAPVVHGLQLLAFTAPGATLLPHTFGAIFVAFTSVSVEFLLEVHDGDTLYPALEIVDLRPESEHGTVTTDVTVRNQHGELVLHGRHTYLLRLDTPRPGDSQLPTSATRSGVSGDAVPA